MLGEHAMFPGILFDQLLVDGGLETSTESKLGKIYFLQYYLSCNFQLVQH